MQVKLSRNLDEPVKHLENAVYIMKHEIFQQKEELQVKFSFNAIFTFFSGVKDNTLFEIFLDVHYGNNHINKNPKFQLFLKRLVLTPYQKLANRS